MAQYIMRTPHTLRSQHHFNVALLTFDTTRTHNQSFTHPHPYAPTCIRLMVASILPTTLTLTMQERSLVLLRAHTAAARLGPTSADYRKDGCIPGCYKKEKQCLEVGRLHNAYSCSFPPEQLQYALEAQQFRTSFRDRNNEMVRALCQCEGFIRGRNALQCAERRDHRLKPLPISCDRFLPPTRTRHTFSLSIDSSVKLLTHLICGPN